MAIKIVELEDAMIPQFKAFVSQIFPDQSPFEKLSFWVHKHRKNPLIKIAVRLYGTMEISKYWIALDDNGNICGTTGIYTKNKDKHEAFWLSWFCVAKEMRGQGIGKLLIEFTTNIAEEQGKKYLRLYTSDDPNEAAAQSLYEKYGFKIVRTKKKGKDVFIYREKILA